MTNSSFTRYFQGQIHFRGIYILRMTLNHWNSTVLRVNWFCGILWRCTLNCFSWLILPDTSFVIFEGPYHDALCVDLKSQNETLRKVRFCTPLHIIRFLSSAEKYQKNPACQWRNWRQSFKHCNGSESWRSFCWARINWKACENRPCCHTTCHCTPCTRGEQEKAFKASWCGRWKEVWRQVG